MKLQVAKENLENLILRHIKEMPKLNGGLMIKTRMDDKGLEHPMEYLSHRNCMNCSEDGTICFFNRFAIPQEVTDYFPTRGDEQVARQVDDFVDKVNQMRMKRAARMGVEPKLMEHPVLIGDFEAREAEKDEVAKARYRLRMAGKWREFYEMSVDDAVLDYRAGLYLARREACSRWEIKTIKANGKVRKEFIHWACPMHTFFAAKMQLLKHTQFKCSSECKEFNEMLDEFIRTFFVRPKWDPDFDIGDPIRGWSEENVLKVEHRVRTRAKVIQRQNRFRKTPMTYETAVKVPWKEFFQHHPEYKDIRNWRKSITIGDNKHLYGELVKAEHPCHGARQNKGNALLVGIHAFMPRGELIRFKVGEHPKALLEEVKLPGWSGEAADWNKLPEDDRREHLGCEFCETCLFEDMVLTPTKDGGFILQFTENVLLDEEKFSKLSWMFAKWEEIMAKKREVIGRDGKKRKVPVRRDLIVEVTVLDKDVEDHFYQYAQKFGR